MEILRTEHLTKIYGKGNTSVTAVNDLSLSVAQGEFVAVVGSSGSGKSTLLHMLGGVDQPLCVSSLWTAPCAARRPVSKLL